MKKKILTNPPFSLGMKAVTERMKAAAGLPTEMEKEGRAIMARSEAAKAGTLSDPSWKRDDSKLYPAARKAISETRQGARALSYEARVGIQLRPAMQEARDYAQDPLGKDIAAWNAMTQLAMSEAFDGINGDREKGQKVYAEYHTLHCLIADFGKAYSAVLGKDYITGEPLEMSQNERAKRIENADGDVMMKQAKAYHATGSCKFSRDLEGRAEMFCTAGDRAARIRVKRKSREAVR